MKTILLIAMLSLSTASFARIHDDCGLHEGDPNWFFAVGFVGATVEGAEAGPSDITVPDGFTFETGFQAVCDELDRHPELWDIPSRDAIIAAIDILWKTKHPTRKHLDEDDTVASLSTSTAVAPHKSTWIKVSFHVFEHLHYLTIISQVK